MQFNIYNKICEAQKEYEHQANKVVSRQSVVGHEVKKEINTQNEKMKQRLAERKRVRSASNNRSQ